MLTLVPSWAVTYPSRTMVRGCRAGYILGNLQVHKGYVPQRAVGLDVLQRQAVGLGESKKGPHLVENVGFDLGGGEGPTPPPKTPKVRITGMSADGGPRF